MHHLYNRGFALAVSMPKLVPLVIVYLCGLIAGGGLQVLILPNAMGHKKLISIAATSFRETLLANDPIIHLRRKARFTN